MGRIYYPVRYRLDNRDCYLLWHTDVSDESDEADGVVHQAGKVPVFRSLASLLAYAQAESLSPVDGDSPTLLNLDLVKKWLRRKRPAQLDCEVFLNAWNLLADLSLSVEGNFDPDKDKTRDIYNKLFWGSNIPTMTPVGKHYVPLWPGRQSRLMRQVLTEGLVMFHSHVSLRKHDPGAAPPAIWTETPSGLRSWPRRGYRPHSPDL